MIKASHILCGGCRSKIHFSFQPRMPSSTCCSIDRCPPTASPDARRAAADARPTQRQDRRDRQRHGAARIAAPCRLFRRPRGAARLCSIGWGRGRGVRRERDCDRANLRGEPDLLSAELPGDRGFQAAHARRAGRAALDGTRGGHVPAGSRWARRATGSSAKCFLTPAAG